MTDPPLARVMSELPNSGLSYKLSVGVPLLVVAATAWYLSAYTLQNFSSMSMGPMGTGLPIATMSGLFSSPDIGGILAFLTVWIVGMVAMMFPAMIPVMSFYSGLEKKGEGVGRSKRFADSGLFLGGYLSLYALLGFGLFAAVYLAFQAGSVLPWLSSLSVAGLVVVLAVTGIWQLTPLKEKSLAKCVSPMGFFLIHLKKGPSGAFRMGAEHGVYCVGCCWLYMLVMLAVAAMSILSMVLLSGLIIVEKAFVGKAMWFRWVSAAIFFSLAAVVAVFPGFLAAV